MKIKDYIEKTLMRYTMIILIIILSIYLLSLFVLFQYTIVRPNLNTHQQLTTKLEQDFHTIREELHTLSLKKEIKQFIKLEVGHRKVSQQLYDLQNQLNISTHFLVLNSNREILASSLLDEQKNRLLEDYYFSTLIERLNNEHILEQSIGNALISSTPSSSYFLSTTIEEAGQTIGYLFFFVRPINQIQSQHEMTYVVDSYNNIIGQSHHFHSVPLGKLHLDADKSFQMIENSYYYVSRSVLHDSLMMIYTLTPVNIFILLIIYGLTSMFVMLFIIFLIAYLIAPKILNKSLLAFDSLLATITNHKPDVQHQTQEFSEFQLIYEEYTNKIEQIRSLIETNQEIVEHKKKIEIKNLEAKFNPHFLYNVLEMLKYEITLNPDNASEIIVKIARLMRYNTNLGEMTVPLNEDLVYVLDYIELQKMRFGQRLDAHINIPEEHNQLHVPKLIVQPLIENAIKHNIERVHSLTIHVYSEVHGQDFIITIKDDGLGISSTRMSEIHSLLEGTNEIGSHIGLKNTHQLIQILYGENYGLSLQSKEGNGTSVLIKIPKEIR